jgi:heme-degrading monooxygenase HmoA
MLEATPGAVLSVLRIPVRPESLDALVASFRELGVLDHAATLEGFRGGRVLRPLREGDPVVVLAEWADASWYQAWLDHPIRETLKDKVAHLVDGEMSGGTYADATPEDANT